MSGAPRPRRRRRWLFAAIAAVLVLAVVELAGAVLWWRLSGSWFSWSAATAMRAAARGERLATADDGGKAEQGAIQRIVNPGLAIHPYLGFVTDADQRDTLPFEVSEHGFVDDAPPVRARGDDRFVVALLGGSVALQLALYAEEVLVAELQKSPVARGRQIEIVRLCLGGWKQPQQLFAVQLAWLRGGEFDAIVNLDGFNEVAMVEDNVAMGVPGWFPRLWGHMMDRQPSPVQQRRIGKLTILREQRQQAAAGADGVAWSPMLQSLWLWRDRRLAAEIGALAGEIASDRGNRGFAALGPGTEGRDDTAARVEMVALWRQASLQLHQLCQQRGVHYFHFLQPNQYVPGSKPIGAEERQVAWQDGDMRTSVEHGYPLLRAAGRELQEQGVAFTDLTGVFADHPEPLYVDTCCHFGRRGNRILAVRMAAAMRGRLDLDGFVAARLELRPATLRIPSPLRDVPLQVVAVAADGREVDVSGAGFGTRYVVEPAGAVAITADGSLRGVRRGSATVTAGYGDLAARVELVCEWPDQVVLDDGHATDGPAPVLRWVGADDEPRVTCTGLGSGARILAAAFEPLAARIAPGQESFGVATSLLPADRPDVVGSLPARPRADRPLFVRVYVVGLDGGGLVAASNGLILTGR